MVSNSRVRRVRPASEADNLAYPSQPSSSFRKRARKPDRRPQAPAALPESTVTTAPARLTRSSAAAALTASSTAAANALPEPSVLLLPDRAPADQNSRQVEPHSEWSVCCSSAIQLCLATLGNAGCIVCNSSRDHSTWHLGRVVVMSSCAAVHALCR